MIRIFTNQKVFILFILLIASITIAITISTYLLFSKSQSTMEKSMIETVERQRILISSLYQEGRSAEDILSLIHKMRSSNYTIGKRGEFVIGIKAGKNVKFLIASTKNYEFNTLTIQHHGIPMKMALEGHSGFIKAEDYKGENVFAAFTYCKELQWGIVAKIPVSEVYSSYFRIGLLAFLIAIILISISIYLFIKTTRPLLQSILENEEYYRSLFENQCLPMLLIDPDNGNIIEANPMASFFYGYPYEKLTTMNISQINTLSPEEIKQEMQKVMSGYSKNYNFKHRLSNGEIKNVEVFTGKILHKNKELLYSIVYDVTERVKIEAENTEKQLLLKKQNEEYEALNEEYACINEELKTTNEDLSHAIVKAEDLKQQYFMLFENMTNGFVLSEFMVNKNNHPLSNRLITVNPAFEKIVSVKADNIIGKSIKEILPFVEKNWTDDFLGIVKNGGTCQFQGYLKEQDKHLDIGVFSPQKGYLALVINDISEQKKSEERYKRITECLTDYLYTVKVENGQAIETYHTEACKVVTGHSSAEFKNDPYLWINMVVPDQKELVAGRFLKILNGEDIGSIEHQIIHKNGQVRWISDTMIPKYNDQGKLISYDGVIKDITERKLAEQALVDSEEKYSVAFQASPYAITISRLQDGIFEEINDSFMRMSGYTREETIGHSITELNIWYDLSHRQKVRSVISEGKRIVEEECVFRKKDGETLICLLTSQIIKIHGEKLILALIIDISERKKNEKLLQEKSIEIEAQNKEYRQLNDELRLAKVKAEESDKLKTAFLQNMSHEIRTPMNAIMGFSELLVKQYNQKEKVEKYSKVINQRCLDLLTIINDLLDIARIESGQLTLNVEQCHLKLFFDELNTSFIDHQKRLNKHHITLEFKPDMRNPNDTIFCDKGKLKQIFINLIGNAFKFTDSGKIEVGYKIDAFQKFIFFVSDTGIGIPEDKHSVIFERFSQLPHDSKHLYGGTGLGLSIVKGLLQMLNGIIWLESEPGTGTTFFFTFPCKLITPPKIEFISNPEPEILLYPEKKILIVEDDEFNAELLKIILSESFNTVYHTRYGNDAVRLAFENDPDLILMDIQLPDIDGFQAIKQILEKKPEIKIIAQTAYASLTDKNNALENGCVDFISKPIIKDQLLSKIHKQLQKQVI